jgi:hypothetical protein
MLLALLSGATSFFLVTGECKLDKPRERGGRGGEFILQTRLASLHSWSGSSRVARVTLLASLTKKIKERLIKNEVGET